MNAIPGDVNTAPIEAREGTYYGQCTELCGVGHAKMTFTVVSLPMNQFQSCVFGNPSRNDRPHQQVVHSRRILMAVMDATLPRREVRALSTSRKGILGWLTTVDHKKIAIMYLFTTFFFFLVGGVMALLIRIQLAEPQNTFLTPEQYNQIFTMHGTTMIFLWIIPVWAGLGNYMVPLMIGARDMAFPRINALSFWLIPLGGIVMYSGFLVPATTHAGILCPGGPGDAGWTGYVPLTGSHYSCSMGQDLWIIGLHLVGIASMLGGINFLATIHNMRAKGMTWGRLPLFVWAQEVTAALVVLASPFLAAGLAMNLLDRQIGTNFFDPVNGGSALLYQFVFWFYSHPAVYIMILPAFGIISEIIPVFSRKPVFGYKAMAASIVAIAFLGFVVFVHHMFVTGLPLVVQTFFAFTTFVIGVPTGVKIFNWLGDDVGREHQIRHAHALCVRVPVDVPDRWHRRRVPRQPCGRPSRARHVLGRRAHSLRAVRRQCHGSLRRVLLLVPEGDRADSSARSSASCTSGRCSSAST